MFKCISCFLWTLCICHLSFRCVYDKLEVADDKLCVSLVQAYTSYSKVRLADGIVPVCLNHKIEHINRLKREELLKQYVLTYPNVDGSKWDCMINGHKVQDKVVRKRITCNSYSTGTAGYEKGDNDFYWFTMPNGNVYVLPEHVMTTSNNKIIKK